MQEYLHYVRIKMLRQTVTKSMNNKHFIDRLGLLVRFNINIGRMAGGIYEIGWELPSGKSKMIWVR